MECAWFGWKVHNQEQTVAHNGQKLSQPNTAPITKLSCLPVLFYYNHEIADGSGENACIASVWFLMLNSSLTVHGQIPEFQSFVKKVQDTPGRSSNQHQL